MYEFKNLEEIISLCKEEIDNNDENVHATLDLVDLKELKNLMYENEELKKSLEELEEEFGEVYGALFLIVRNRVVQPKGIELGKSDKEITKITIDTIDAYIEKHVNYEEVLKILKQACTDNEDGDHIPRID